MHGSLAATGGATLGAGQVVQGQWDDSGDKRRACAAHACAPARSGTHAPQGGDEPLRGEQHDGHGHECGVQQGGAPGQDAREPLAGHLVAWEDIAARRRSAVAWDGPAAEHDSSMC